jgi:hypothetical protein
MIPHCYIDASDDPAAYAADQANRQAVTIAYAYEHLCDETVWVFNAEAEEMGLEPWRMVSGVDRRTDGSAYIVQWGSTAEKEVPADFRVYAQRRDLHRLGLPEGEPGGGKVDARIIKALELIAGGTVTITTRKSALHYSFNRVKGMSRTMSLCVYRGLVEIVGPIAPRSVHPLRLTDAGRKLLPLSAN